MSDTKTENSLYFRVSANTQRLLGRELISSEYVAVGDLVKNAYDAGATQVTIEYQQLPKPSFVITDNGLGMSFEEFKSSWMTLGYSEKEGQNTKTGRPFLGQKGVGRFAADRIAKKLKVLTKTANNDEALSVTFDWSHFDDQNVEIQSVPIEVAWISEPHLNKQGHGTRLELSGLRKSWNTKDWNLLRNELQNLINPYITGLDFNMYVISNQKNWLSGKITSLFDVEKDYVYIFNVSNAGTINRQIIRENSIAKRLGIADLQNETIERNVPSYGPINGTFYYIDRARAVKMRGFTPGVAIYRDGFRVEPYGREDDDWLEVKNIKASRQGHAPISPSRLFGYIAITREANPDIVDSTNREQLLMTFPFIEFQTTVKGELQRFAEIIQTEKGEVDKRIVAQDATRQRQIRQQTLSDVAKQLAHQLRQPLEVIGLESGNLQRFLEKNGVKDDFVYQAVKSVKQSVDDINDHVKLMLWRAAASSGVPTEFSVCDLMQESKNRFARQYALDGIEIIVENCENDFRVRFIREVVRFALDNFIANAVKSVILNEAKPKNIKIKLTESEEFTCKIIVQDNGTGVPKEYEDKLFKGRVPTLTNGTGSGLWYVAQEVETAGGKVGFENVENGGALFFVEI